MLVAFFTETACNVFWDWAIPSCLVSVPILLGNPVIFTEEVVVIAENFIVAEVKETADSIQVRVETIIQIFMIMHGVRVDFIIEIVEAIINIAVMVLDEVSP